MAYQIVPYSIIVHRKQIQFIVIFIFALLLVVDDAHASLAE